MVKQTTRVIGLLLGVCFLLFAFLKVNWDSFYSAVASINPGWLLLVTLTLFLTMLLRAVRWHLITGLPRKEFLNVWAASCIGYLGTAIYPARAGDVLRILRLQQTTGIGSGHSIGSAVIDRVVDGLALCILLLLAAPYWVGDSQVQKGLWTVAVIFLAATFAGVFFVIGGHRLQALFQWFSAKGEAGVRFNRWYEDCLKGLQILRSSKLILTIIVIQGIISLLDILACWLLFLAFGWNLPFLAALVVLVYLAAAMSLPSTPGYVGVYQVATLLALGAFSIEESASVAYGTVLQVLSMGLFVGSGGWAHWGKPIPPIKNQHDALMG